MLILLLNSIDSFRRVTHSIMITRPAKFETSRTAFIYVLHKMYNVVENNFNRSSAVKHGYIEPACHEINKSRLQ